MDIVAESLSAKILKSREVLVNGQDIMDYIRSKLSTAVVFSGVYDDIDNTPLSAQFNGSIVIVDSKEYIYSDKSEPNHWQEIGDETAIGQLSDDLIGEASDLSSASTINAAKNYAKDLVDSLDVVDAPVQNQFVVAVSQENGVISVTRAEVQIPAGLSSYADTVANLSNDGYATQSSVPTYDDISTNIHLSDYALTSQLSTAADISTAVHLSDYALTSQLSTAADISTAVHLSDYALSNDVSSKTELETAFNEKLDATAAGKAFSPLSTYSLYEHVSYNGQLYECSAVVSATGDFQLSNWQLVDMTSPDATLDITNQGQLRLVAADGTTLWHQGYNLAVSSSTTLSIDVVNRYDFAWNATSATALTIPTPPNGKVGDFILDVTLTALAPFLSTVSYDAGSHVIQDGICWTSDVSAAAGSWDAVSGNWTSAYAAWDQTSSYTSADNPVVKDGMLWKCAAASTTTGDWTPSDWTTASFGLPQLEAERINVVVPENNNLADMLTFAPGQMAELYFTQTSFTASGQPTWKVVRQNVEEAGI